jgi:hypothetical protein
MGELYYKRNTLGDILERSGVGTFLALDWAFFQVHGMRHPNFSKQPCSEKNREKLLTEFAKALLEEFPK